MKKILITLPVNEEERSAFEQVCTGGTEHYDLFFKNETQVQCEDVKDADAIIGMISEDMLFSCEKLKWLQIAWAGAERFCREDLLSPEVRLTNASGAYGNTVSEHMIALTMALTCSLPSYIRQQEAHRWELQKRMGVISGSIVTVFGTGDIGRRYAAVMRAMGALVIGISRTRKKVYDCFDEQYTAEEAEQVIGRSDVIALVLPGGEQTKHIIDESMIAKMKKGVFLINAGRGSTIDTNALIQGLKQGIIGGAGLDVFEEEPLGESELWDMENVIITPHAAGKLEDAFNRKKVVKLCLDNLYRYVYGMELKHIVDRRLAY